MATEQESQQGVEQGGEKVGLDRSDESQSFVDTSKIDFDPDEGLYTGTAVDGTSEIAGPHMKDGDGERDPEQMQQEAQQQAEEAGVAPDDTPAAKSPVARAAEQEREQQGDGRSDGDRSDGERSDAAAQQRSAADE